MKHIILAFSVLFLMASCNNNNDDDDNGISQNEINILGEWVIDKSFEDNVLEEFDACDSMLTVTFTVDSISSLTYEGEDCYFSYGNTNPYSLEEWQLIVETPFGTQTADIIKLNSDSLQFQDVNDEGVLYEAHYIRP